MASKNKPNWPRLMQDIKEAKKDPAFVKTLNDFIRHHTGKSPR